MNASVTDNAAPCFTRSTPHHVAVVRSNNGDLCRKMDTLEPYSLIGAENEQAFIAVYLADRRLGSSWDSGNRIDPFQKNPASEA
jgi:hypothetical protein